MPADVLTAVHSELMDALAAARSTVVVASPYLTGGIALELSSIAKQSPAHWTMLTALDPHAVASGHLSTTGLRALLRAGVDVRTLDRLHAKAYLADNVAFVGSGNLTSAGLGAGTLPNVELTTRLSAPQRAEVGAILQEWRDLATPVNKADLDRADRLAKSLPVALLQPKPAQAASPATQLLIEARSAGLWTKAVYGSWHEQNWSSPDAFFASSKKVRPQFKTGDLALIYVRDYHSCASIVEVTSEAEFAPGVCLAAGWPPTDAERWPWVNRVRERLTVPPEAAVRVTDLGFRANGLENGHRKMSIGEFTAAVRAMTGEQLSPYAPPQ